jgi:hypothetical protein
MTVAPCSPQCPSIQPSTQGAPSPVAQRALDNNARATTAQVMPASDDVFSSTRQSKPSYLQGVSHSLSRGGASDNAAVSDLSDDETEASKRSGSIDGQINDMDVYPAERERIMRDLDSAITTTRSALAQVDHHWNARTQSKMNALFGADAKSDDVRAAIKSRLEHALSGLEQARANKGKDIFIQDPGVANSLAYALRTQAGHTGQIVFSKTSLGVVDDARIEKTLIHEAMHVASNLRDHWYVKTDETGNLYRKAPSSLGKPKPLPPLTAANALDNADSVAYAAVVLATNGSAWHDEL